MTDVNFPIIQHYKDFWGENWGMITTSFTYAKDWEELTGVMENMMKLHCRSCDGWGHATVDISKGKTGIFAGKKIQCPTQEVLDGVIALHVEWKKFKAAKLLLWPPPKTPERAVNLAVLANTGNY